MHEIKNISDLDGIDSTVGMNNVLGDKALFQEILVVFYQDHHHDGQKLQSAIKTQDLATAKHLAHTLKGVACSVGAMKLYEAAKALDSAINDEQHNSFDVLLDNLLPELAQVMKAIIMKLDVNQ